MPLPIIESGLLGNFTPEAPESENTPELKILKVPLGLILIFAPVKVTSLNTPELVCCDPIINSFPLFQPKIPYSPVFVPVLLNTFRFCGLSLLIIFIPVAKFLIPEIV